MSVIYVASERDGEGKTALCAALAHGLRERGRTSSVLKPLASGGSDPDAEIYERLLGQPTEAHPPVPGEGPLTTEAMGRVAALVADASRGVEVVFVEGPSHLSIEESARLAESIDARALVVSRYRHDMSASQLTGWRAGFGNRLAGFVINGVTRYKGTDTRTRLLPSLRERGLDVLGAVPEDRRLLGSTVAQIAECLEGRFIACHERADTLVEHLMVGGMGMDPGELYFGTRENKAVIVRGDRPDIQMSALGTPTACLVLTKGIEPIEYVKYEAEQEEVPVMVVPADTLGVMSSLASLMEGSRFDHPAKLRRFAELLDESLDLPALFDAVGAHC